jgi:phosphoribosylamine-glycine ligase
MNLQPYQRGQHSGEVMTTKHTAGPWRVGDAGATVFGPPNGNPSPETVARVTKKANARLIAAAPELLAAIVQAVESAGFSLSGPTDKRAAEHGEPAWVCNARAALAKARGE